MSLVAELQKKSKVVQYYMMRDQAGALTTSKSDENKSQLAKYGGGVMSAIYSGIKGSNQSMTLELSLEINKKLQAVLEDTLLKNITLKVMQLTCRKVINFELLTGKFGCIGY